MVTIPTDHRLYIMGDYHEQFVGLIQNLKAMQKPASLILLGDYDAYRAQDLVDLAGIAERLQVVMYLLRGNHDNPKCWQDRELSNTLETKWFHLLEDIDLLMWKGEKMITISGAVSVDRTCLRFEQGHCWPKEEGIPKDAASKVKELGGCDILLTHTGIIDGMTLNNPFIKSYASADECLIDDIKAERKLVKQIQAASGCSKHYFGHFHQTWKGEQLGIDVRCLDICELLQLD